MSELPSGWRETILGEVATIINGGTPSTKNISYWGDDISWITPKDLSRQKTKYINKGEKSITTIGLEKSSARLLPRNTILFTSRAPIGYVTIAKQKLTTNQGFKNIITDEINTHFIFMYYWLINNAPYIEKQSSGSTFSEASTSLMKSLNIKLPSIKEQKAIANILSSFDNKIELLKEQNRTLETLSQTIFKEWFVNNVEINKWSDKKLNELVTIVDNRGKTPPVAKEKTDFPLIEVNALDSNLRIINYNVIRKYVDKNTFNTWFRNKLNKYDIVMATVGTLGNFSMYLDRVGNIAQNLIGISPIDISPFYIYQLLKHRKIEILKLDIGGVQPSIKVPHLLSLNIKIPPVKLLNKYDSIMKVFTEKLLLNDQQIQTLQKTRDTLLPKLMSGKLRVKGFEDD